MYDLPDFPKLITIEPTNVCNRDCFYCPRHFMGAPQGFIDVGLYRRLLDEIAEHPGVSLFLFRRGESLLHKKLPEMLTYARDKVREMIITTNATLMPARVAGALAETIDFIHFSLAVPSKYAEHRGGDYEVTRRNIERFLALNKRARTQVSMVATKDTTDDDRRLFVELWKDKVDRIRIYEQHSTDGNFGSLEARKALQRQPCCKPFTDMVIMWNGHVARCNHDWDGPALGQATEASIAEIWRNATYERLRREHRDLTIGDPVCRGCNSWQTNPISSELGVTVES